MDPTKPKERRHWRPRMSEGRQFNPFVRESSPDTRIDNRTLAEIEVEASESEAREYEAEPISRKRRALPSTSSAAR
jgi:hypothetical protein